MRSFISQARRKFRVALAALVVAALAHCSWEDARELAQWTRTLAQHRIALPTPVQAPVHDCNHEYGCICRGATQVQAVDVAHCKAQPAELLLAAVFNASVNSVVNPSDAVRSSSVDRDSSVPRVSGRQLRALYASLVI
jgi:hypothetical protein